MAEQESLRAILEADAAAARERTQAREYASRTGERVAAEKKKLALKYRRVVSESVAEHVARAEAAADTQIEEIEREAQKELSEMEGRFEENRTAYCETMLAELTGVGYGEKSS